MPNYDPLKVRGIGDRERDGEFQVRRLTFSDEGLRRLLKRATISWDSALNRLRFSDPDDDGTLVEIDALFSIVLPSGSASDSAVEGPPPVPTNIASLATAPTYSPWISGVAGPEDRVTFTKDAIGGDYYSVASAGIYRVSFQGSAIIVGGVSPILFVRVWTANSSGGGRVGSSVLRWNKFNLGSPVSEGLIPLLAGDRVGLEFASDTGGLALDIFAMSLNIEKVG